MSARLMVSATVRRDFPRQRVCADQAQAVLEQPAVTRFALRQCIQGGALFRDVLDDADQACAGRVLNALSYDMQPAAFASGGDGAKRQVDGGAMGDAFL
jgi:hypothetical protein